MTQNAIHPLGYGLPMRATFALAVFYSAPDTSVPPAVNAPICGIGYFEPMTGTGYFEPFTGVGYFEPEVGTGII